MAVRRTTGLKEGLANMKTWQRARYDVRGFTLVELMVVVTIMGILLAVSAPAMSRFAGNWRLNGAAANMAMVMRSARSAAVSKDVDVVFTFDDAQGQYSYIEDTNGNGDADAGERQSAVQTLPPGITINDYTVPQTTVTFNGKGSTADGGTIVMKRDSYEVQIRVYSGTGNIEVERKL
jgi:prepilin-type N-terminal cleavage/methylation domain-containing protein